MPQLAQRYRVIAPDLLGRTVRQTAHRLFVGCLRLPACVTCSMSWGSVRPDGWPLAGRRGGDAIHLSTPQYCQRLILVSSGGLGPEVGWILRLLAAPGAEFVLPVIAPEMVLGVGNQVRSLLTTVGLGSPRAEQVWTAYSSLADPSGQGGVSAHVEVGGRLLRAIGQRAEPVASAGRRTHLGGLG